MVLQAFKQFFLAIIKLIAVIFAFCCELIGTLLVNIGQAIKRNCR